MEQLGMAGFAIIAFAGFIAALVGIYSLEQMLRRALSQ